MKGTVYEGDKTFSYMEIEIGQPAKGRSARFE